MGSIPNFIPTTPGDEAVLDLSHTLAPAAIRSISNSADSLSYKPKVVILPSSYSCPDLHQLSLELADSWHTGAGRTLLMVVDLKGHKVRMIGSPDLNSSGITSVYITNSLIPKNFVPYMKAGDLASAVRVSLVEVNKKLSAESTAISAPHAVIATSKPPTISYQQDIAVPQHTTDSSPAFAWNTVFGILVVTAIVAVFIKVYAQQQIARNGFNSLKERINRLHEKADQLAQSSDFVDAAKHPKIVHAISDFFAQLQTLETAYEQTQRLMNSRFNTANARDAVAKCSQYVSVLNDRSDELLAETNQITGVVSTYEANAKIDTTGTSDRTTIPRDAADASVKRVKQVGDSSSARTGKVNKITLASGRSFQTPSWVVTDNSTMSGDDGLALVSVYLDKQRRRRELESMSYSDSAFNSNPGNQWLGSAGSHSKPSSSSDSFKSSTGGGTWGHTSSSSTSSSSSSDGGGSWDSGSSSDSSSSGSSDGGGSW